MHRSRRALVRNIVLGTAAAAFGDRPGAAQLPPPVAPVGPVIPPGAVAVPVAPSIDVRAHLRQAGARMPASNARGKRAVERTLERLDDLNLQLAPGRLILVNIASAELIAYDNGREALRSRVVVGANKTRTPQMTTFVTAPRFNPPWYVPASIVTELRAAGTLSSATYRTINGRIVQPPGPTNPLGPMRIGLLDSDGIFLHGTSTPSAFSRPARALSHGCVRVEQIRDLTAWLLDRTPASIQTSLDTGRTLEPDLPQEVQVALAYLTAWPDRAGRVVVHGDPYGLDEPGARRAPVRRVSRPVLQTPEEAENTARPPPQEDNPL